jgi:soluble lytic murein transglycosylase-like protein
LIRSTLLSLLLIVPATAPAQTESEPDPELRRVLIEAVNDSDSFEDRFEAEVWLTDMSGRLARQMPNAEDRLELLRMVHYEANRAGLYPELVLAVIDVESNFDRFAISSAGALGLMQVMPFWLDEIGRPDDNLIDAQTNLRMGCTILKYYMEKENNDLLRGLARCNGSYGRRWYGDRVVDKLNRKWFRN